jgi:uncharacterized membrane protein (UPF0127 family)
MFRGRLGDPHSAPPQQRQVFAKKHSLLAAWFPPNSARSARSFIKSLERKHWGLDNALCVFNMTQQSFLGLQVERADTLFSRLRGLLGRTRLAGDEGVWVVPSRGIHSIGLMFPMDVVYLDEQCQVIHVVEQLAPFRIAPYRSKAHSVLELPSRAVSLSRTQVGDMLLICPPEALKDRWQEKQKALEQYAQ